MELQLLNGLDAVMLRVPPRGSVCDGGGGRGAAGRERRDAAVAPAGPRRVGRREGSRVGAGARAPMLRHGTPQLNK